MCKWSQVQVCEGKEGGGGLDEKKEMQPIPQEQIIKQRAHQILYTFSQCPGKFTVAGDKAD